MSPCANFSCRLKGSYINEDNHCHDLIGCRVIRAGDDIQRCKMCYLVNSCRYAKEIMKNGKHN